MTQAISDPGAAPPGRVPRLASGVEVLGPMAGSGYRNPPHLVRRGDGQVTQLTPLLAAIVEAIDGRRDIDAVADRLGETHGRALHPADVEHLVEAKLAPLGLLALADGTDPVVRRSEPLLGLRGRLVVTSAARTRRLTRPFLWLFRPAVVVTVLGLFGLVSTWVLLRHGLGSAVDDAMADPALLLVLIGLILASGAFHEIGHATACRYGGADPGVMGAAVYLVWPAFYTDVTDSYRLGRAGRLRVDLGGLYFNAVFTVATAAVWAVTGTEALLLLVPVQLLQMARQLVPVVRFDGYHILADLVGVPDLFARIRPTLARAVPWRRDPTPNPLTPRAQAVVVTWVALVVPILVVSFGLLLWNLPGLVTAALRSLGAQSDLLRDNAADGRFAAVGLGVVAMITVAFVPLSAAYLSGRLARRSGQRFWAATEERPAVRTVALCAAAAVVVASGPGLVPGNGGGDLAGASEDLVEGTVAQLALSPAAVPLSPLEEAVEPVDARPAAPTPPAPIDPVTAPITRPSTTETTGALLAATAEPADRKAPRGPAEAWPFPFDRPDAPGAGDNQAVAVTTRDGGSDFDMSTSLDWVEDGSMRNANEAWALAACVDCAARAVAFQVVVATDQTPTALPENIAVAYNHEGCDRCRTTAIAVQVAVTLETQPDNKAEAELRRLVASLRGRQGAYRTAAPAEIRAELREARNRVLEILEPWLVDADTTDEATDADEPAVADTEEPATDRTEGTDEPSSPDDTRQEPSVEEGEAPTGATEPDGATDPAADDTVTDDEGSSTTTDPPETGDEHPDEPPDEPSGNEGDTSTEETSTTPA